MSAQCQTVLSQKGPSPFCASLRGLQRQTSAHMQPDASTHRPLHLASAPTGPCTWQQLLAALPLQLISQISQFWQQLLPLPDRAILCHMSTTPAALVRSHLEMLGCAALLQISGQTPVCQRC